MSSAWTVRQVVDLAVECDLVDAGAEPPDLDENLSYHGSPDHAAALSVLDELGIVYECDYKFFRNACQLEPEDYREELEFVAGCTRGLLTITDVELVDADDVHLLRFRCNGERHEWPLRHGGPEEDLDTQLTFAESVTELLPADSTARWCFVDPLEPGDPVTFVFGDPEALRRFGDRFGLTF